MKAIVSESVRIRHPQAFEVGDGSIIDDFCYFSTRVRIGRCSHIAASCTVAGGVERLFSLGDFSSLSSGVRIWCTSDDFVNDVVTIIPAGMANPKAHLLTGDVTLQRCTAIGANSVVMPANSIPEGTVVGALSFVPPSFSFKPWSIYAGIPIRYLRARNKDQVLAQVERIEEFLDRQGG